MSSIERVAVIGAGSAKGQDYITALLERSNDVKIVAIVINKNMPAKLQEWATTYDWKVIKDGKIDELDDVQFDTAIIALPHDQHHAVTKALLSQGRHLIKEKPLAMTLDNAKEYHAPIFTTVQRSTHPLFVQAKKDLEQIGKPISFSYTYTFNLPGQTSGWRADPEKSGGGVVLDMGYHAIDVLIDFFGEPTSCQTEFGYKYDQMKELKLEDSSRTVFGFDGFTGTLILDRHADSREERFVIQGEHGTIELTPTSYELKVVNQAPKRLELHLSKIEIIQKMFDKCLHAENEEFQRQFDRNMKNMRVIDRIYSQKQ